MDIQLEQPKPTYNANATNVQPAAVTEMKVTTQEASASRIRGGGAGKDCLIGCLACFVCCECCESLCDCFASIICCPCEVLC